MKKKLAGVLLAAVLALSAIGGMSVFAAEGDAELTAVPFPAMTAENWTQFAWSTGETVSMEIAVTDENAHDGGSALRVDKTVESADGQANVYYQQFGALVASLSEGTPYGVRFWVYSTAAHASGNGIGFLFGGVEQTEISCVDEGSDVVQASRALDYEGYRQYTVPFPDGVQDIEQASEMQIMLWGNESATVYYSGFEVLYGEVPEEPEEPDPPQVTDPPALGDYSMQVSGFNNEEEMALWGLSGQSGTLYKTELNTDPEFIKEGEGSLKYSWDNATYGDAWTEIYFNITDIIQANKDSDLTGITFWIYNNQVFDRDDAVWWLKIAEKDGSEYSADTLQFASTTNLDFVGWKKMEIPFSAVTELQSYSSDENGQLDVDQIAFIKIGMRNLATNNDFFNSFIYVDDVQLTANKPFAEVTDPSDPTDPTDPGDQDGSTDPADPESGFPGWAIAVICVAVVVIAAAIVVVVLRKKKGSGKDGQDKEGS